LSEGPRYYPVFLDLRGKRVVVVGGGTIARHKVDALLDAGAAVTVVAPEAIAFPPAVTLIARHYRPDDLVGAVFVVAATDDAEINAMVACDATDRGVFVNAVDDPAYCSAILPSVVRRGELQIAISTSGASPVLAQRIRARLEEEFGPEYADLVELLRAARREWTPRMAAAGLPHRERGALWRCALDLPLLDLLRAGQREDAERLLCSCMDAALGNAG
jgi:precorrin-2 dehydrogenase/sirohydrochlorin ferrochelatase